MLWYGCWTPLPKIFLLQVISSISGIANKNPRLQETHKMYHANLDQHTALLTWVELTTLVMKGTACMHAVSHQPFSQMWYLILYAHSLPFCVENQILYCITTEVNNPCFMFSLEWICSWLYLRIGECPSNSPFPKNNGAEAPKGPRPIVLKEWRETRTFSNLKSTHCS